MTLVDGIVFGIMAAFIVLGAIRGLVRDVASLVGIGAGAYLAWRYGPAVGAWLQTMMHDGRWTIFLGYALTFFGVVAAASLVGLVLSRVLHETPLGWVDQLLGAGLGLAKAVILVWLLITITLLVRPEGAERVNASPLTRTIVSAGSRIVGTYRIRAKERKSPDRSIPSPHRGEYVGTPEDKAGLSVI